MSRRVAGRHIERIVFNRSTLAPSVPPQYIPFCVSAAVPEDVSAPESEAQTPRHQMLQMRPLPPLFHALSSVRHLARDSCAAALQMLGCCRHGFAHRVPMSAVRVQSGREPASQRIDYGEIRRPSIDHVPVREVTCRMRCAEAQLSEIMPGGRCAHPDLIPSSSSVYRRTIPRHCPAGRALRVKSPSALLAAVHQARMA